MATSKQVNYALSLMRKLGMSTEWMGSEHKRLGATMRERSGKVEKWVQGMNAARASELIDDLLGMQRRQVAKSRAVPIVGPAKTDPVAAVAKEGKKESEKAAQALKKQAPRKEPRGKTARAVAGLPPLKPKKVSDKPLSRRSTLGTLCERVR